MAAGETRRAARALGVLALLLFLAACASTSPSRGVMGPGPGGRYLVGKPYKIHGKWYFPAENPSYDKVGIASWYGREFRGNKTANGERFDPKRMTAAHTTLPMPVLVRVTNLDNGRSVVLRVNDRGPFVSGRLIDVSEAAADALGFRRKGTARVRVEYVGRADQGAGPALARASPAGPSPPAYALTPPASGLPGPLAETDGDTSALAGVEGAIRALPSGSEPLTQ